MNSKKRMDLMNLWNDDTNLSHGYNEKCGFKKYVIIMF